MLRDLSRDGYLRLSDNDAQLFELLDGTRSLVDLIGEAEQRFGADRARRGSRACSPTSASAASSPASRARRREAEAPASFWRRLITPREKVFPGRRARASTRSTGTAAGCCSRARRCG